MCQILRWNWSRVAVALSFARSVAPTAFALRYSVLPLIDAIMFLAFEYGVEPGPNCFHEDEDRCLQESELQRSTISLQTFISTKYFEAELCRSMLSKPRARKAPDS